MTAPTLPDWWTGLEPHLPALRTAVGHLEAGQLDRARVTLGELASGFDLDRSPDQLAYLLAAGLQIRASPGDTEATNLYLRGFDVPHLRLFHLVKRCDPLFRSVYPIANGIICDLLGTTERATLIDLGTGDGAQLEAVLEMLAAQGRLPRTLTIVAIDLDADELGAAGSRLAAVAAQAQIELAFVPVASMLEDLDAATWEMLANTPAPRVVNATFALHHLRVRSDGADARSELLDRLYALAPEGLVMCEPSADFNLSDLRQRFRNAARFFGTLFDHLDALDISVEERRLIKFGFWGREVLDVLGGSEEGRCERFETAHRWVSRLCRAGFQPYRRLETARAPWAEDLTLTVNEGFVGLGSPAGTVLTVIAATRGEPVIDGVGAAAKEERVGVAKQARIDVETYLRLLVEIAVADGVVHPLEREFIDAQALLSGIDPQTLWAHEGPTGSASERLEASASIQTRRAVIRDCVLLSRIDGTYDEAERRAIRALASRLQIDDATLAALEVEASGYAPPVVTDVPDWLRECWALQTKSS